METRLKGVLWYLGYSLLQWILSVGWVRLGLAAVLLLVTIFLRRIITRYVFGIFNKLATRTKTQWDDHLFAALRVPSNWFIGVIGIYIAIRVLAIPIIPLSTVQSLLRTAIVVLAASAAYRLTGLMVVYSQLQFIKIDRILAPFLARFIKFAIIALAITMIAEQWGFNVNGFVAGLGVGGLAVALAARDALANLFAGVIIITEKPFDIGDWILTPSCEGTVEDINFRSTKIRTFAQALVTVPNSQLANNSITNWTKMGKRQITFQLGVSYRTKRQELENVIEDIRTLLRDHPDTHDDVIMVNFDQFGSSSLNILLYFFTKTTVWADYLMVREQINLKIMEIVEHHGVQIAFPSQSLYLETPIQVAYEDPSSSFEAAATERRRQTDNNQTKHNR